MTNTKAIIIKDLCKEYYKKDSSHKSFWSKLKGNKGGQPFYALKDINLEINKGEVIGIIGPNGAGKSTLLKVLAEVTPPSRGSVEVFGKVASILEIGIGFQPELSGCENIFLSGKLYGLTKKQIVSKLDKIIEMFGFTDFINTEVKHYSSGMYMRLAFSIIINIEADIYLFDEILSVGDAEFQDKALKEIEKLKERKKTIGLVTHNPKSIFHLCNKILAISNGHQLIFSKPAEAIFEYNKLLNISKYKPNTYNNVLKALLKNYNNKNNQFKFEVNRFSITNSNNNNNNILIEKDIEIQIYFCYKSDTPVSLTLTLNDGLGKSIGAQEFNIPQSIKTAEKCLKIIIPKNSLNENVYSFDIHIIQDGNILQSYQSIDMLMETKEPNNKSVYVNFNYNFRYEMKDKNEI